MNGDPQSDSTDAAIAELRIICKKFGSKFFEYMSGGFRDSSRHYLTSSSDIAAAAVQPKGEEDLVEIIKVLAKYQCRFAVKSGGHAMNPGFSSTKGGIQISMVNFDQTEYDKDTTLLHVGVGSLWGAVYQEASRQNRGVVGGLNPAVGVGGFMLGGGYSLKSSRLGLAIDNVQGFRIVTPQGDILTVTDKDTGEKKELFNALRGGGNNFGIVTEVFLKTHEQTVTYGAVLVIPKGRDHELAVKEAIMDHISYEKRNRAVIEVAFKYNLLPGVPTPEYTIVATCVFDGPKPTDVPFAAFRKIVHGDWKENLVGWDPVKVPVLAALDGQYFVGPTASASGEANSAVDQNPEQFDFGFREMPFKELHLLADHTYKFASFHPNNLSSIEVPAETDGAKGSTPREGLGAFSKPINEVLDDLRCSDSGVSLGIFAPGAPSFSHETNSIPKRLPGVEGNSKAARRPLAPLSNLGETNLRQVQDSFEKPFIELNSFLRDRGRFACIMVSTYTKELVEAVARQAERASQYMAQHKGRQVLIEVWPFHPSIFDDSPPDAAWPHNPGDPYSPLIASFLWEDEKDDNFWLKQMNESLDELLETAVKHGCARRDMPRYLNTSLESVPVEMIYGGKAQLEKLGRVRAKYDADDVMSLTGGFKIPLHK